MSSYANEILNAQGFNRKLYPELLEKTQQRARTLFGEDVDLTDESPTGQFCKVLAYDRAEDLEVAEMVYLAADVNNASGFMLDIAVQGAGVTRFSAEKAKAAKGLRVAISPKGGTLPAGFIAAKANGVQYRTTRDTVDLDADGFVFADAEAIDTGPQGNAVLGELTQVMTPSIGSVTISSVTNVVMFTGGRSREDDAALRARYNRVRSAAGAGTTDSILSSLLSISDVRAAIVVENDDDDTDENGIPGHSFAPTVLGGDPPEIGAAILQSKAAGIKSFGDVNVTVLDSSYKEHIIGFSYAEVIPIWAEITIKKNSAFPADGVSRVETLVVQYVGGYDSAGQNYPGRGMGEDVVHFVLSRSITTPGIDDMTIKLRAGDSGEFVEGNIPIGVGEVAEITPERIVITVVS